MIDAYASEQHYCDHVTAVWRALPPAERGTFRIRRGLHVPDDVDVESVTRSWRRRNRDGHDRVTLVGSYSDAHAVRRRVGRDAPLVVVDHGVGQTYVDVQSGSYAGGPGYERGPTLMLSPTSVAADCWREVGVDAAPVGPVILDGLPLRPRGDSPVVVSTFHWRGPLIPEQGSAWPEYRDEVCALADTDTGYRLVGHAHPRIRAEVEGFWLRRGLPFWRAYRDVLCDADVLVADNTSALYHFAALDRPVVVLDSRHYRRDVSHGLRFWEYADVGVRAGAPEAVDAAIRLALSDPPAVAAERRRVVGALFGGLVGGASVRAATATVDWTHQQC